MDRHLAGSLTGWLGCPWFLERNRQGSAVVFSSPAVSFAGKSGWAWHVICLFLRGRESTDSTFPSHPKIVFLMATSVFPSPQLAPTEDLSQLLQQFEALPEREQEITRLLLMLRAQSNVAGQQLESDFDRLQRLVQNYLRLAEELRKRA